MTFAAAAAIGLAAALTGGTIAWAVSLRLRDTSIADVCWGPGFVLLAWLYRAALGAEGGRSLLVACLVTLWGGRLAVHIHRRSRGRGEDPRYAAMRRARGDAFRWKSLFLVFWLQGTLLWIVSVPLLIVAGPVQPTFPGPFDVAGLVVFTIGFTFEVVGDHQLSRFKSQPGNRGLVMDRGLWRYTRHPNYFGDAVLWWGVYVFAARLPGSWMALVGPALMTFLLVRVSGVALVEESLKNSKPAYGDYIARTPAFVPWWPRQRDVRSGR